MLKSSGVAFVSAKMKLKRSLIFFHISTDILIWSRHFEGNYGYFQGNLKILKKSRLWSWSDLLSNVMFGKQVYHEPTHKKKNLKIPLPKNAQKVCHKVLKQPFYGHFGNFQWPSNNKLLLFSRLCQIATIFVAHTLTRRMMLNYKKKKKIVFACGLSMRAKFWWLDIKTGKLIAKIPKDQLHAETWK